MHVISISQVKNVLKHIVMGQRQQVMLVGQFGGGKTAAVHQLCEENGYFYCPVLLGQYDTVDLKGTPWVRTYREDEEDEDGHSMTVWHPASTLPFKGNPNFPKDRPIILFLDELTSASVPVLGICYQLVDKYRVGEHELMDNVYIVCAGNRESDKGIVTRMPMPLCNRITWFEVGIDMKDFTEHGVRAGWMPPEMVAFFHFRKPLVCTYDPAKAEKVVATPRTWEKAAGYYSVEMPHDIKLAAMAGAVGDGPVAEFYGFLDSWAKIADMMPKIHKDPEHAPLPKSDEPALAYAVAVSISGAMTAKTADGLYAYLTRMEPEFVVLAWQLAAKRDPTLLSTNAFLGFTKKYKAIFKD